MDTDLLRDDGLGRMGLGRISFQMLEHDWPSNLLSYCIFCIMFMTVSVGLTASGLRVQGREVGGVAGCLLASRSSVGGEGNGGKLGD